MCESYLCTTSPMEKQLHEIDGEMKTTGWVEGKGGGGVVGSDCMSIPVCVPPGGTNVSFEQFVDSPLSSWPAPIQTGSIFWTLGMPRIQAVAINVSFKCHGFTATTYFCAHGYQG